MFWSRRKPAAAGSAKTAKGADEAAPPVAPYAYGLPRHYKLSLGFRVLRVCAAATAATCAVLAAQGLLSTTLLFNPLVYFASEAIFAVVELQR